MFFFCNYNIINIIKRIKPVLRPTEKYLRNKKIHTNDQKSVNDSKKNSNYFSGNNLYNFINKNKNFNNLTNRIVFC